MCTYCMFVFHMLTFLRAIDQSNKLFVFPYILSEAAGRSKVTIHDLCVHTYAHQSLLQNLNCGKNATFLVNMGKIN